MPFNPSPNQFNSYGSDNDLDMMTDNIRSSSPRNFRSAGDEIFARNDDSDEIDYRKESSKSKSKSKFVEEHKSEEEASDQKLTLNKLISF
jgi:hypothetical protein